MVLKELSIRKWPFATFTSSFGRLRTAPKLLLHQEKMLVMTRNSSRDLKVLASRRQ